MYSMSIFKNSLIVVIAIIFIVQIALSVALVTVAERKVIGTLQRRLGPNIQGLNGLLQPFADGLKLGLKESIVPVLSSKKAFLIAPVLSLSLSFFAWSVMPLTEYRVLADISVGLIFLFCISGLSVYSLLLAGWSSNSKYSFLGALRSAAQMVAYEVSIGLIVIVVVLISESLNLTNVIQNQWYIWYVIPMYPAFAMFFVSCLAETGRAPFDLPEAEAELVSGYNVEYSAMGFALFFIAEYGNILLMSSLLVILYFGGYYFYGVSIVYFAIKLLLIVFSFLWVRAGFPRYRYDQLMKLGWKVFLPISLGYFFFVVGFIFN